MEILGFDPIRYPWEAPPAEGAAIEVAEGVFWLRLPLPMALNHVNIFALDDGDGWTVIDTGLSSPKIRAIWTSILEHGPLSGKPVRRVVLTHHHPDHVGLVGWFQSEHGADLVASRTAWLYARMLTLDEQDTWPEETLAFYRAAGMEQEVFDKRASERPFNFADVVWPMPLGFTRIAEGDTVRIGGRTWDVHMGNGHAAEHATFWCREEPLVLGGDQLLPSISPNLGVYPTEPDSDPVGAWIESCERLARFATEEQLVLPGHKLPFTGLPARMRQLVENHHFALERLMEHLTEPRTAHDCFPALFRREIGAGEYGLALAESIGHLNHLYRAGRITRQRREDGAWAWRRAGEG
ncbi:MBL fold metallo-hydrolase [Tropicimonas marinistellae]|uniref:MBL fold metallo-hydrolase n=1 Tax=Tropicimonas marinistellae TaxID=1739787 RepID=UPI0008376C22|nr:MBL fold metallo-hydrolase [Tropicimonas marinistellae]